MNTFGGALVVIVFLATLAWSLLMQRRSARKQEDAIDIVKTEMELTRTQIKNQERIIALLEQMRDR